MPSFYYYDQNPSEFCFFANDGFIACVQTPPMIGKFKYERKNEKDSGRSLVVVQ